MLAARSRVRRFLPSLTANFAAERLTALAKAEGKTGRTVSEVLFVCVRNAGRSQMAAGFLSQLAGDRVLVRSAGSLPVALVDANVVTAMDEVGVYLGGAYPKPLTDEIVRAADVVVTMGCGDACPVYPGKRYLDWPVEDPEGRPLPEVRRIRDEIHRQVRDLTVELSATP
jgi:arsenate reductase